MKKLLSLLLSLLPAFGAGKPRVLTGEASYYSPALAGRLMANGQPYDPRAFTLACSDLPLGASVYITCTNRRGVHRTAHATVTDRGPAERLRQKGRIFDLSEALFRHLEDPRHGLIQLTVKVLD